MCSARLVFAGGALATLGLLQFVAEAAVHQRHRDPRPAGEPVVISIYGRNGLVRPAGTAVHPIEFGAALTMILPLASALCVDGHPSQRRAQARTRCLASVSRCRSPSPAPPL